jgi:hypothetical protein
MLKSIVLLLSLAGVLNCQEIYVEIGPGQQELKSYIKTFAAGHVDKYVIQVYTPDGQISSDTVSEWPKPVPYEEDFEVPDVVVVDRPIITPIENYPSISIYCFRYVTTDGYEVLITPYSYYKQKWVEY